MCWVLLENICKKIYENKIININKMDIYTDVIHLEPSDIQMINGQTKIAGMSENGLVVVYAPWCYHCQKLKNTWTNLSKSNPTKFLAVNSTDKDKGGDKVGQMLNANGFPTILVVKDGVITGKYSGDRSSGDLQKSAQ